MTRIRATLLAACALGALSVPAAAEKAGTAVSWGAPAAFAPAATQTRPGGTASVSSTGDRTGAGVAIAILDTGIAPHVEFGSRISPVAGCFAGCTTPAALAGRDDQGHGTHVAGIAGGATVGQAPGSTLMSVKVLDSRGSGSYTAIASGIRFAANNGARVINMSLGGPSGWSGFVSELTNAGRNAVVVAAAGNGGTFRTPSFPAAHAIDPGVVGQMIIVGAVDSRNRIASFSQTPGSLCNAATRACARDFFLVAPGVGVRSSVMSGGYQNWSGTSMATPFVAGVAATVIGQHPFLTSTQVVDILLRTATDLGPRGVDNTFGRGLVNKTAALGPVGATFVPTSGATAPGASGSGSVAGGGLSGPLAGGVRGSSLLRRAIVIDEYGRDFKADLASAARPLGFSLDALVFQQAARRTRGFGFAAPGLQMSAQLVDEADIRDFASSGYGPAETNLSEVFLAFTASPGVDVAFGANLASDGRMNAADAAASPAFAGLLLSADALNSPYLKLASGGLLAAAGVRASDTLTLKAGIVQSQTQAASFGGALPDYLTAAAGRPRNATAFTASAAWTPEPGATLSLSLTHTAEHGAALGGFAAGALALAESSATTAIGVAALTEIGAGWTASAAFSAGATEIAPGAGSLLAGAERIETLSYGIGLAKTGVFGKSDSFALALTRPMQIVSGAGGIVAATAIDPDTRVLTYERETVDFASGSPQTDLSAGYRTALGAASSLEFVAIWQSDVSGIAGESNAAGLVRLRTPL